MGLRDKPVGKAVFLDFPWGVLALLVSEDVAQVEANIDKFMHINRHGLH